MKDRELLQRVAAKDHAAFKELVARYQTLVMSVCYRFLHNKDDAEDVAQEVFIQLYKSADKLQTGTEIPAWIYRVAINRSLNFIRDNKRFRWYKRLSSLLENGESEDVSRTSASDSHQPDIALEKEEQRELIQEAIDSLPKDQRVAFVLHKNEGLSYQEITEVMQRSLPSVESLIHRAKLNLQKRLIRVLKETSTDTASFSVFSCHLCRETRRPRRDDLSRS